MLACASICYPYASIWLSICWHMLAYASICLHMLAYVSIWLAYANYRTLAYASHVLAICQHLFLEVGAKLTVEQSQFDSLNC